MFIHSDFVSHKKCIFLQKLYKNNKRLLNGIFWVQYKNRLEKTFFHYIKGYHMMSTPYKVLSLTHTYTIFNGVQSYQDNNVHINWLKPWNYLSTSQKPSFKRFVVNTNKYNNSNKGIKKYKLSFFYKNNSTVNKNIFYPLQL